MEEDQITPRKHKETKQDRPVGRVASNASTFPFVKAVFTLSTQRVDICRLAILTTASESLCTLIVGRQSNRVGTCFTIARKTFQTAEGTIGIPINEIVGAAANFSRTISTNRTNLTRERQVTSVVKAVGALFTSERTRTKSVLSGQTAKAHSLTQLRLKRATGAGSTVDRSSSI
jgi:hypothetical protein